jgi:hypothetical protein
VVGTSPGGRGWPGGVAAVVLVVAMAAGCVGGPPAREATRKATGPAGGAPVPRAAAGAGEQLKRRDFDGDGRADLVAGATGGPVRGRRRAGLVEVAYGSATPAGGRRQVVSRGAAAVSGERFGQSLASGDLDHDGYADLVVGTGANSGVVAVAFGSRAGLAAQAVTLARPAASSGFGSRVAVGDFDHDGFQDVAASNLTSLWVTYGRRGLRSGRASWKPVKLTAVDIAALAAGDVTGDGIDDLAVVFSEDDPADTGTGAVFRGSPSGLGGRVPGTFPGWGVGAVAVGDVDGDGYGDVVAGNAFADAEDERGQVYLTRGSAQGLTGRVVVSPGSPGLPAGTSALSGFGGAVATGDADGDGYTDVAVGAGGDAGAALLLHGGPSGLRTAGGVLVNPASAGMPPDVQGFGQDVALTDLDGDGRAELAVSARTEDTVTVFSPSPGAAPRTRLSLRRKGESFGHPLH